MKKAIKLIFAAVLFGTMLNVSYAVYPTYTLTARNFEYRAPNELVFDITILNTNSADTVFQFALGQYYFGFDTNYCAGGTITYDFAPGLLGDSSDLPFICRPRTPSRVGSTLRVNSNASPGLGNGPIISGVVPGSRIIKMRLRTSATAFTSNNPANIGLKWRNIASGNPYTKIFGYIGGLSREMTDSTKHFIDVPTGIGEPIVTNSIIPQEFSLSQNYPNPFNPSTKIEFALPVNGNVVLKIYDVSGKEVKNLVNEFKSAGVYNVSFNGADLASGMYFYRISVTGEKTYDVTRKMILLK